MRKLALLMAVVFLTVSAFGQTTTTPAKTTTKTKVALKKDGTPDKRFKDNKQTTKPAGPLKKDGTKDMRYKANKDTTKIKK